MTDERLRLTRYADVRDGLRQRDLRQSLYDEGGVVMRDCLLDLHGDDHRTRRRIENRLFRRGTFRMWESELVPAIIDEAFAPYLAAGRADLIELGYRTTMNLTALVAGVDRTSGTVAETDALQEFAVRFSEGATVAHSRRDHDAVRREVAAALRRFDEMFFRPSCERRARLLADPGVADDRLPRDVLTALMRNGVPRDVMLREVAFYLQAGSHSTADAFTHAADEILRWRADNTGDELDDDLFLQRCVHEALRLHPASPVAWRRALAGITLRSGRTVPAGAFVVLDIRAANRDPEVFGANPDAFDPRRPVPDGVAPWGHTFGGGMHSCIGMELDGGVVPRDGDERVLGTVTLMVRELLRHGVTLDPDHPPARDGHSEREHFGRYPVLLASRTTGAPQT
jgi:cytochrome P450